MPGVKDVHQNKPLENISIAYIQNATDFVAMRAFPIIPVEFKSDSFYKYSAEDFLRDESQERAPGTESAGSSYGLSTDTYSCKRYALHKDIDDETRANSDSVLDPDRDATQFLTQKQMIKMEKFWAGNAFKTGVWTGSSTGTDITPTYKWDTANGVPTHDVSAQKLAIKNKTGYKPNTMIVTGKLHEALKANVDIRAMLSYNERKIITPETLAAIFEVDSYIIADGIYNTAAKGVTGSYSSILSANDCLLCYVEKNPGLMKPSAGYTFAWKKFGNSNGLRMKKFRMEDLDADRIEHEFHLDFKIVAPLLGAYFTACIS